MEKREKTGWFRKNIPRLVPDALAIAGGAALVYGVWLIFIPAGWIIAGVVLITSAVIWSRGSGSG